MMRKGYSRIFAKGSLTADNGLSLKSAISLCLAKVSNGGPLNLNVICHDVM